MTKGKVSRAAPPRWGFGEASNARGSTSAAWLEAPSCKPFPCRPLPHPSLAAEIASHPRSGVMKWPCLGASCQPCPRAPQQTLPGLPLGTGTRGRPIPRPAAAGGSWSRARRAELSQRHPSTTGTSWSSQKPFKGTQ